MMENNRGRKRSEGGDMTKYFSPFASQSLGSVYSNDKVKSQSMYEGFRGHNNQVDHDQTRFTSSTCLQNRDNGILNTMQLPNKSHSCGPTTSSTILNSAKWKLSSSTRRTDTSSDELSTSSGEMDEFVKMDTNVAKLLLYCRNDEEKIRVYKEYVHKLLSELVMSETHSEELDYELGIRSETIQNLEQKIEELTAVEKYETLREFEDSTHIDSYGGSYGEMRAYFRKQEAQMLVLQERAENAESDQAILLEKLQAMEQELSKSTVSNRQLQTDLQNETKRREESNKKISSLREKLDTHRRSPQQDKQMQSLLDGATNKIADLEVMIDEQAHVIRDQAINITELKDKLQDKENQLSLAYERIQDHTTQLQLKDGAISRIQGECDAQIDRFERRFRQSDIVRRQLHNQVMELKGNIRVFCRVRPVLSSERAFGRHAPDVYHFPDYDKEKRRVVLIADQKTHTSYMSNSNNQDGGGKKWPFEFDQVFDWNSSQQEVFEEVSALVQSAVDGYNVSIFAYGQTGSGKTYTMQGDEHALSESHPSQWDEIPHLGIVGRTISHIFSTCEKQRDHGWEYRISFEMYEIYNETIRDLLAGPASSMRTNLAAQVDTDGIVQILNLSVVEVEDEHHAMKLLKQANNRRAVKKTNRNDVSSRSHCITTLKLVGHHGKTGLTRKGAVYLVDLAGSERLKSSGSGNDPVMLKEAQSINKSLSALGNVISAISTKKSHIPFRDSKLTYVLQNTLGRDSKTLMICTLSPLEQHREESLNTLRFAKKVNTCELALPPK